VKARYTLAIVAALLSIQAAAAVASPIPISIIYETNSGGTGTQSGGGPAIDNSQY
jgi:hypothetical protein